MKVRKLLFNRNNYSIDTYNNKGPQINLCNSNSNQTFNILYSAIREMIYS